MLKNSKVSRIVVVFTIPILVGVLVSVIQAQRPFLAPPPPLPNVERSLSQPGATSTPRWDEKRPNDILPPTVTPIPFKESIDLSRNTPMEDKSSFIILKGNGDYVEIFVGLEHFENNRGKDIREILNLSKGDKIINSAPPASYMGQGASIYPDQLEENNNVQK